MGKGNPLVVVRFGQVVIDQMAGLVEKRFLSGVHSKLATVSHFVREAVNEKLVRMQRSKPAKKETKKPRRKK